MLNSTTRRTLPSRTDTVPLSNPSSHATEEFPLCQRAFLHPECRSNPSSSKAGQHHIGSILCASGRLALVLVFASLVAGCASKTSDNSQSGFESSSGEPDVAAEMVDIDLINASNLPDPWIRQPYTERIVTADFNDLGSAIGIGTSKAELATQDIATPTPDIVRVECLNVSDDRVHLECVWLDAPQNIHEHDFDDPSFGDNVRIRLRARTFPFANAQLETKLIDGVVRRLSQLHGVRVAPVR
ncbi:MAG: hypothetical protein H6815_03620 [Phycisphaeraceae bacterium]|nr:hypothetical protein [Phycisphaerales bacterium]MCB9859517.1 hypothetical protein [Phycisphaeraceae bacterium]